MVHRQLTAYVQRDADTPAGQVRVTASTADVDRYGDVIAQDWRLDHYRRNPVVLWGHDSSELPIGRAVEVGVVDGRLSATIELDTESARGAEVARLIDRGVLGTVSVGWIPGKSTPRAALPADHPHAGDRGYLHVENELLEISVVSVPGNAAATVVGRSLDLDSIVAEAVEAYIAQRLAAETPTAPEDWRTIPWDEFSSRCYEQE